MTHSSTETAGQHILRELGTIGRFGRIIWGSALHLKFGIAVPGNLWQMSIEEKHRTLARIHAAGFHHMFMADHVSFRNGAGTDGFIDVAALSQLHDSLSVMISIYLLPLRHPLPVARQMASMHKIAPGRFIFGIGVGGEDRHEIEVCGVDPRTRGQRTNEALHIIRRLMQGEAVDFNGEHFTLQGARIRPTPEPRIPIVVGGRSNAALARTAEYGDGWIATWCSTRRYREATALIREHADVCGRSDTDWWHGYQPWVGLGRDRQSARRHVAGQMESFYKVPFANFERYTPYGTPAQTAAELAEFVAAGCRFFNLKVCAANPREEIELGAELVWELTRLTAP